MKTCNRCHRTLPLTAFAHVTNGDGGVYLRHTCKPCKAADKRRWRQDGPALPRVNPRAAAPCPCDPCYRRDRCKTETFECAAFAQWTDSGQYTPALVGAKLRHPEPEEAVMVEAEAKPANTHGGYRGPLAIDEQLRAQVIALRRAGYLVNDICQRLALHRSSERAAVQTICEAQPRRHQVGIESFNPGSRHRIKTGNWA